MHPIWVAHGPSRCSCMDRERAAIEAGHPEWAELPASAKEAREDGSHKYYTGKPCKRDHIDIRTTRDGHCMACNRFTQNELAKQPEQREKARKYEREQYHSNPKVKEYLREYQSRPESRAYKAQWHQENKERRVARIKEWEQENLDRVREYTAARRAAERNAMPPWVDREALRAVYEECARLTRETGKDHHVDHIIPRSAAFTLLGICRCSAPRKIGARAIPLTERWRTKGGGTRLRSASLRSK